MRNIFFSVLRIIQIILYSLVGQFVGRFRVFLMKSLFGLVLTKKMLHLQVQIVHPFPRLHRHTHVLQICFCLVIKETLCFTFRPVLLKHSIQRNIDDSLHIDDEYFKQMVDTIYPKELRLNKTNTSDTEAPFLDLNLSISNGIRGQCWLCCNICQSQTRVTIWMNWVDPELPMLHANFQGHQSFSFWDE